MKRLTKLDRLEEIIQECKESLKEKINGQEYFDTGGDLENKIYEISEIYIREAFDEGGRNNES